MRKRFAVILLLAVLIFTACAPAEETPVETIVPEVTETPVPEETEEIAVEPVGPFYIKINLQCNTVTVYSVGEDGSMTPCKAMVCSTGKATPTSGVYDISFTGKWEWLGLFGDVYGHYCTQISGNILFHSVPYLEKGNPASLEYWEFDQLGTTCSLGCIRLQVIDAKWVFDHKEEITGVEFYSDSDPGPLGKPVPPNIGSNLECRNWDPTDPDENNPWNK